MFSATVVCMRVLLLGEAPKLPALVEALDALEAQGLTHILVAMNTVTRSRVYYWAHHERPRGAARDRCEIIDWAGWAAIARGERPPVAGIDLVRAVLSEARGVADQVLVVGPVWAFWEGKRREAWDVQAEVVLQAVQTVFSASRASVLLPWPGGFTT